MTKEFVFPKYKPGDKVTMHMAAEDQDPQHPSPDEIGVVDGAEGWDYETNQPEAGERWPTTDMPDAAKWIMYVVTVPKSKRFDPYTGKRDPDDDGLREVDESQLSYYRPCGPHQVR